jgi:hypothetical protein
LGKRRVVPKEGVRLEGRILKRQEGEVKGKVHTSGEKNKWRDVL